MCYTINTLAKDIKTDSLLTNDSLPVWLLWILDIRYQAKIPNDS